MRSWLLWKNTGINPITFGNTDDAHGFNGLVFKVISIFELLLLAINAFVPSSYKYLLFFWYLEHDILKTIGWILLIVSLLIVTIAQNQMAQSWRIGIDHETETKLVKTGLFSVSRNPIFLGIMLANLGLFLILPNAFVLLIIGLSTLSINTQVRLEEDFLRNKIGKEYEEYYSKVRRWI